MTNTGGTPAGWYHAPGDAEGTQRYWDGAQWVGEPQAAQQAAPQAPAAPAPPQQSAPPAYSQAPPPGGAPAGYVAYGAAGAAGAVGNLAEPWKRIVARLIDGLILGVAGFVIGIVIAIALDNILATLVSGLIGVAIGTAYEVLLTTNMGATPGKKIFNMQIVQESDGADVTQEIMLKRYLPSIIIGVVGAVPILGLLSIPLSLIFVVASLIFIFTDDKRRSVYDKFGKTVVKVNA